MTVTPEQLKKATLAGPVKNLPVVAEVANEVPMSFYQLLALMEKESAGLNVYGSDVGGTLSGFDDPVTEANWRAFRHEVIVRGRPSNGVGPAQLTYKGFFTDMEAKGLKPWVLRDNMLYGARLYWGYYRTQRGLGWSHSSAVRRAGTQYNAGEAGFIPYGDRLLALTKRWYGIVGIEDTTN